MQQIRQVIQRKQAQVAQLSKEIELLQQAEEKLREIAPLLAEGEDEDGSLLAEEEEPAQPVTAAAAPSPAPTTEKAKAVALRWP